jgi:antirestriction protein ArdC
MAKSGPKRDHYQEVTDRIVAALEAGPGAWTRPWRTMATSGMPLNGSSGRKYNGINVWLLALSGYGDPRWFTFRQAREAGGHVRRGEHGTQIVFWRFRRFETDETDASTGKPKVRTVPMLRTWTVFNAEQIEGLPETADTSAETQSDPTDRYNHAEALVDALGVDVRSGGG